MIMFKPNKDKKYSVIIIGAGGTGSWLSSYLAKLQDKLHSVHLVDGDIVEPKNMSRQNFIRQDVGRNKAAVVARAASRLIGPETTFIYNTKEAFISTPDELGEIVSVAVSGGAVPIIVGCVDNNASRKIVHDFVTEYKEEIVWVDSGNNERAGQVIVMAKDAEGNVLGNFVSPFEIHEEFSVIDGDERRPDQISCAEQSESAPQNIAANVLAATTAFMILNKIIAGEAIIGNEYKFDSFAIGLRAQ